MQRGAVVGQGSGPARWPADTAPQPVRGVTSDEPAAAVVSMEGINQTFISKRNSDVEVFEALRGIDLEVRSGEFVALVGPSGCGKTTLLNVAAGLVTPQEGVVQVMGGLPAAGRDDVAYMFARDALLPWRTVLRNVAYGLELRGVAKKEREARALELLEAVDLTRVANSYRSELSQGMRQRVALARTFALPSPLLLMDEPFGALDAHLKIRLGALLLKLWERERRTVLFVTHDLHEAIALADRVIIMHPSPGRIVADIPIPLERPRSLDDLQTTPEYHDLYTKIWTVMRY